ncbi:MAG: hypothetical protein U0586_06280 [Candidatus Brocadiaceae bacterium]
MVSQTSASVEQIAGGAKTQAQPDSRGFKKARGRKDRFEHFKSRPKV